MKVAIFRDEYLTFSEAFIVNHAATIPDASKQFLARSVTDWAAFDFPPPNLVLTAGACGWYRSQKFRFFRRSSHVREFLHEFDLLISHFAQDGWRICGEAKRARLPHIVVVHGSDVLWDGKVWQAPTFGFLALRRNWSKLGKDVECFVAVSEFVATALVARGIPREKIHTIYLGSFASDSGSRGRHSDVSFVGRLVEGKGIDTFLTVLELIPQTLRVEIVGDGPLRGLVESRVKSSKLRHHLIKIHGAITNIEARKLIAASKTIVIPSRVLRSGVAEGLPTVLVEALSAGTPVIASDVGGISEALRHGGGFLCKPDEPASFAHFLQALLENHELWVSTSTRGKEVHDSYFHAQRNASVFRALAESVAKEFRSAAS